MNSALTRPRGVRACFIAAAAIAFALSNVARTFAQDGISINSLQARLAKAQSQLDLDPGLKVQIIESYRNALATLESAASERTQAEKTRKIAAGARDTIPRLEREMRSLDGAAAVPPGPDQFDTLPLDALERLDQRAREEVEQRRLRVAELQRELDNLIARPLSARLDQAELRAQASTPDTQTAQPMDVPAALAAAQLAFARASETLRQARLARIAEEIAAQPALERIAQLELQVSQAELDARVENRLRVQALLEQREREEIANARAEAARARQPGAAPLDPVLDIQARILERRAQIAEVSFAGRAALATLTQRQEQLADMDQAFRATKLRTTSAREGGELDKLLLVELRALPVPDQFRKAAAQRAEAIAQAADARFDAEIERAKIADLDHAVTVAMAKVAPDLPVATHAIIAGQVRDKLVELRRLLERTDRQLEVLVQALRASAEAESTLLRRAQDFRTELIGLLLWIPVSPIGRESFTQFGDGAGWVAAGGNWSAVFEAWQFGVRRNPLLVALAAGVLIVLSAARGWFKRKLPGLAPGEIPLQEFGLRHTNAALVISILLALPVPFAMWTAGLMLQATRNAPLFVQSAGAALHLAAFILLYFRTVRWLFDANGVAIKHFGWSREPVLAVRRAFQPLMALYVPLIFVATLGTSNAPESVRQGLGRIAFVLAMIAATVFWRRAFHAHKPIAQLEHDESTIGLRLVSRIVTSAPGWLGVGLALCSLAGFYFLAAYVHQLVLQTILLVFAASLAYGLIALWLALQRQKLAEVEAQQASAAASRSADSPGESPLVRVDEIDAEAIDAQTRRLLNLLMTIVIGAGLWLVWAGAFRAMDFGTDWMLWSYTDIVEGKPVTHALSISALLLAIAVGLVTYIGTRNIGGLLDIVLLQRLRLEADANYAIKTVARYATVGAGVFLAAGLLGTSWSSVQWLIAALGVGLGFGLQEIVANFVSGLIILGERPIRIGDIVTVGETSGTVTRIRARATVITDWDNKEVMIPNKAFITERVINWTLSDQTTRLLLKIGVAYGTDPKRAEKVLTDTVRANPNVLADPAPSVYFMGFGESSLDFEIRAYVDATNKRLVTTHELNTAIAVALAQAGIEIPFPQRDLHIRSAEGLQGLAGRAAP